jgi:hypothetical protein
MVSTGRKQQQRRHTRQQCVTHASLAASVWSQSGREDLGWMFCPYSGYMLQFDAIKGTATCPQSGYSRRLEGAAGADAIAAATS